MLARCSEYSNGKKFLPLWRLHSSGGNERSQGLNLIHLGRLREKLDQDVGKSGVCVLIMFCCKVSLIQVMILNGDVGLGELDFFFFNITELVRMDIQLQWVASDNVDFYTFLARNLVLKSGNWRRCRIWESPPTNVTHSWPYFLL